MAADLLATMYDAPGIGLAAIQVAVPKRVLVIDLDCQANTTRYLLGDAADADLAGSADFFGQTLKFSVRDSDGRSSSVVAGRPARTSAATVIVSVGASPQIRGACDSACRLTIATNASMRF